jgi:hypothetical protein
MILVPVVQPDVVSTYFNIYQAPMQLSDEIREYYKIYKIKAILKDRGQFHVSGRTLLGPILIRIGLA